MIRRAQDEPHPPTADGSGDVIDVELLRDAEWLAANNVRAGGSFELSVEEIGAQGWARVSEVGAFGKVSTGPGCVVTGRLTHYNGVILDVELDGQIDLLATASHRVFSVSRGAWVAIHDLEVGEELDGVSQGVFVTAISPIPAVLRVYNLEIESVHSFRVSPLDALVHNANTCGMIDPAVSTGERVNANSNDSMLPNHRYEI
ncbi:MAG: Hint domain-containing protein, partial [Casimicrobiaceae bacterium]